MQKFVLLLVDLLCLLAATVFALILRDNLVLSGERIFDMLPYLGMTASSGAVIFLSFGLNRTIWRFANLEDGLQIIGAVLLAVTGAVACGFAADRLEGVPRAVPILQVILAISFMVAVRAVTRLHHMRRASTPTTNIAQLTKSETVLVFGINWVTDLFLKSIREEHNNPIVIAGVIGPKSQHRGRLFQSYPVLGTPEELQTILRRLDTHGVYVDRIVVTSALLQLSTDARHALSLVEISTNITVDYLAERVLASPVGAAPSFMKQDGNALDLCVSLNDVVESGVLFRPYWAAKRMVDLVFSAVAIVLAMPLLIGVSLVTLCDVGAPILFWQQRPGRFGRRVKIYKFRTMKSAYNEHGEKLTDEMRLSSAGRFLRRTRLDELPQLFNILAGQMSFVGPRPLLPGDQLDAHSARLAIRPGLTGWAQVNGGREVTVSDKAAMDIWYVHKASFGLDLRILGATVRMLIWGERVSPGAIAQAWRDLQPPGVSSAWWGTEKEGQATQHSLRERRVA